MQFIQPETLDEAMTALSRHPAEAKVMAGGTSVVLQLQQREIAPRVLIDLGRVRGLDMIDGGDDGLHIGPLALLREVAASGLVQAAYPALADACRMAGNVRIRNQATLGGNLAEADYATDPPAVLLALNASVTATSASGVRQIPLAEFFVGAYRTALQPDELLTDIFLPALPAATRMIYLKFKSRSALERPSLGVSAVATFAGKHCTDLRIAIGAACEVPRRLPNVEALASGHPLSDELIEQIADAYATQIETLDDLHASAWYRTQMIRVHVRRALEALR